MPFAKILCPIDFSPGSRQAMVAAARLARDAGAELVLAHAWYVPPTSFGGEHVFPPHVLQEMREDAQRGLDVAAQELRERGARRVVTRLVTGVPWSAIVETLRDDQEIDLAVLGTHGRTGLSRVMLGSVTEKVVRHAPCSVLVVHPDAPVGPFKHALCPIDFSDSSHQALELAAELVQPEGSGLTLLHVVEVPVAYSGEPSNADFVRDLDRRSAQLLDQWAARMRTRTPVSVSTRSRIGRPGAEIVDALESDGTIDLVSLGSHGRTGIRRALLGSVAERIARHARVPVLVCRARA